MLGLPQILLGWGGSSALKAFRSLREGNGNPPVFLPGESQGRGSLVGCRLWGHTELDTTEQQQQQELEKQMNGLRPVPHSLLTVLSPQASWVSRMLRLEPGRILAMRLCHSLSSSGQHQPGGGRWG